MLIYIVEDEENIRELESYTLEKNGYIVRGFENAKDFYRAMERRLPSLILLDVMLPGEDGLTILDQLKSTPAYAAIPVIIVSAKTTELDRVKGLDQGADDYLCKPFGVMELLSRVKARLRNVQPATPSTLHFEDITISDISRTVTVDGSSVELTYKEFELLKLFMENPGIVLRRDDILDRIWGHESSGRTLDVHIRSLRSKLGERGSCITTVRNVGYKLEKEQ